MSSTLRLNRLNRCGLFASISIFGLIASAALAAPGVDPNTVAVTLAPGSSSAPITKVVHTPVIPPNPDIIFLADTTGSTDPVLSNVKSNATAIMNSVVSSQPTAEFGAISYKDFNCDAVPYSLDSPITASISSVQAAINTWTAGGGCDTPESQINALYTLATDPATGFRPGSSRVVVWFGDSSGHDPSNGHTIADAINALVAAHIEVIAIPVNSGFGDGLDSTGQATAIATATGGKVLPSATPDQVSNSILAGLMNLPATVTPKVASCDPGLSVVFSPPTQTVPSGTDATFTETISTAPDVKQCAVLSCVVNWTINGSVSPPFVETNSVTTTDVTPPALVCPANIVQGTDPGLCSAVVKFTISAPDNCDPNPTIIATPASGSVFAKGTTTVNVSATDASGNKATCSFTVTVNDTEAPVVSCALGTNPAGNSPSAGLNPKSGQRPDGFYLLNATDNCDIPQIFVHDSGSGAVFGPYAPGTQIKLTQAPGATPSSVPMTGVVSWHVTLKGDMFLTAVDSSGNVSLTQTCLVPPPPK